jgi:predicted nuclease of predicted toxin-antitoxin system
MQPDWEIWLDTNISPAIAKWMNEETGFLVKSSYSLSLHHLTDLDIYTRAREQGNGILLSKDADFPELISRLGSPPKLISLKIGNCDNRTLWDFLGQHI